MPQYMLMLQENPATFASVSPDDFQKIISEYRAWRLDLAGKGLLAGGAKLADEGGRELTKPNGQVRVTDGPYAEAKEVMGGYFLIVAPDYDQAVSIASTCPHLKYGKIQVRQVDMLVEQ